MKRTAKRVNKKPESIGEAVAGALVGLGMVAAGAVIGYAVGSEKQELERKVRKLDQRTKILKNMVDRVEGKTKKMRVVTPDGSFPLFDQSEDIEA